MPQVWLLSVSARAISPSVEGDIDHIIAHSMACTLEGEDDMQQGLSI